MIRNTFQHLQGIGDKTEGKLWQQNMHTWEELLDGPEHRLPLVARSKENRLQLEKSLDSYTGANWDFFENHLPASIKWRAFGPLRARTMYVDIETNGYDKITVIGIYDGTRFHAFVAGENIDEAPALLEQASLVVTYNGTGFDMPLIRARFPSLYLNHIHVDLMWPLRKLGFRGGLKQIERDMGLLRSDETAGLSGWDAVYLWQEHLRGSKEALVRLLQYNEEDVRNLEPLMEWGYETLRLKAHCALRP